MNIPQRIGIGVGIGILILIGWWILRSESSRDAEIDGRTSVGSPSTLTQRARRVAEHSEISSSQAMTSALLGRIDQCWKEFSESPDAATSREILAALRQALRDAPDEQAAAAAMASFLKSGKDVSTLLPFEVGQDGVLETAPTLRTALLDLLVSLDPTLALEIARAIMDQTDSPDEYALALRNLAWNDLDGDLQAELSARFHELLNAENWRKSPSAGYLEAFDAAVQLGSVTEYSAMLEMAAEGEATANSSLTRASMMALDRMTLRNPGLLIAHFSSDSELGGIAPKLRASLLSRLDLTDPDQRETFVTYLTTTSHGDGELDYFSRIFPNGNYLHGHWMITTPDSTPSISQRAQEDRKVLAQLDALSREKPEIQSSQTLVSIRRRLLALTAVTEKE